MKLFSSFLLGAILCLGVSVSAAVAADKGEPEVGVGVRLLALFADLDLSDRQKSESAKILQSHRAEVRKEVDALVAARVELFNVIHQSDSDENSVRAASQKVAKVEEELAVKRAQVLNELRPLLTEEQKAILQSAKAEFVDRIGGKLSVVRRVIDRWIDKHAQS